MSNIIFCFPPIISTMNSSLCLARKLKSRGHTITYIGIKDCETIALTNGFNFCCIYETLFPAGWMQQCIQAQSADDKHFIAAKKLAQHFNQFTDYLLSGGDNELKIQLESLQPDLVIISTSSIESILWALIIHKIGLKSLYLFDVLGGVSNHTVPPVHTDIISTGNYWAFIKNIGAWQYYKIEKILYERFLAKHGMTLLASKTIKQLATYCHYPVELIQYATDMPSPQLQLPELILFPNAFEFPNVKRLNRYYAEAAIDLNRIQVSFPWQKLHESRPLVYVALGTLFMLKKTDYENFFRLVIDVAKQRTEWDWVISIGNHLLIADFETNLEHIIIVNQAPQLSLLKKATFMITHGGPNSIKECIYFAVPMILFPLWFDQFGTVARVEYHHLGLKANINKITVDELQNLVTEITTNPCYKDNIKLMQKNFMALEQQNTSVDMIENLIKYN